MIRIELDEAVCICKDCNTQMDLELLRTQSAKKIVQCYKCEKIYELHVELDIQIRSVAIERTDDGH